MSTYKVDTEFVKGIIEELQKLKARCEENMEMKPATSEQDSGRTYGKTVEMIETTRQNWEEFVELIDKTISFLTSSSDVIDENDTVFSIKIASQDT